MSEVTEKHDADGADGVGGVGGDGATAATTKRDGSARGRGVVIGLILLGMIAAGVTYYYWTHFVHQADEPITGGVSSLGDRAAAPEDDLEAVAAEFTDAMETGRSTDGPADAAASMVIRYPNDPAARNLLANILLQRGDWEEAYQQMQISLEHNPNQAEVNLNAGTAAMKLKRYEAAAGHYSQAVGLNQRDARYRVHYAQSLIALDRFDEARGLLLAALRADSTMHQAYQGMSELFTRQNNLPLAIQQITKAIENTPAAERQRQVQYIREKAKLLRRANQPEDALITLKSLLAAERHQPDTMHELAVTYGMLGRPVEAAGVYEEAMEREPAQVRWPIEAARWRIGANDYVAARGLLERAREIRPDNAEIAELAKQLK